jgi:hypothetical protein
MQTPSLLDLLVLPSSKPACPKPACPKPAEKAAEKGADKPTEGPA